MAGKVTWDDETERPAGVVWDDESGANAPTGEKFGKARAAFLGGTQGASFGFGDEIAGALRAAQSLTGNQSLAESYRAGRDEHRDVLRQAEEAEPEFYRGGDMAGSVATAFVPGLGLARGAKLAGTAAKLAGLGAVSGLGGSDADLTSGRVGDMKRAAFDAAVGAGVGAGAGALGYGAGKVVGAAGKKLGEKATERLARAEAKAVEMGEKTAKAETLSARSEAGRDKSALMRALEHVRALRSSAKPEDLTKLENLESTGVVREIEGELLGRTVDELPETLAKTQASKGAFRAALETQAERSAENSSQAKKSSALADAWSYYKRYGEGPTGAVVGGYLGDELFDSPTLGVAAGSLMFGRTRGTKALLERLAKPGNQMAIARALRGAAGTMTGSGVDPAIRTAGRLSLPIAVAEDSLLGVPALRAAIQDEDEPPMAKALRRR